MPPVKRKPRRFPKAAVAATSCVLCFRLVVLDGFNLTACSLVQRKALLKSILPRDNTGRIRFADHVSGSGERLFQKLEALQLEGMVMKRKDSVYAFMRSRDWLKVRTSSGRVTIISSTCLRAFSDI